MHARALVLVALVALTLPSLLHADAAPAAGSAPGVAHHGLRIDLPDVPEIPPRLPGENSGDGVPQYFSKACDDIAYVINTPLGSNYLQDTGWAIEASPRGDIVVVAGDSYIPGFASKSDFIIVAYDQVTGAQRWLTRWDGPGHLEDHPYDVAYAPDGSVVYVSGWSESTPSLGPTGNGFDYAVVALDAQSGSVVWSTTYDGTGHGADEVWTMSASPDGSRVFLTGLSTGANSAMDLTTLALDAGTGAQAWVAREDGGLQMPDWGYKAVVAPDSRTVYVEGWMFRAPTAIDYAAVAYDAATGARQWLSFYAGPGADLGTDMDISRDGTFLAETGFSTDLDGSVDVVTRRMDAATGHNDWVGSSASTAMTEADPFVRISPDGTRVYVAGPMQSPTTLFDLGFQAFDAGTGAKLWEQRYDVKGLDDFVTGMALSPDGQRIFASACITSSVLTAVTFDYDVHAVDAATGALLWSHAFNGGSNGSDAAWRVSVSPDSTEVFVTGWTENVNRGFDITTMAFDAATGASLWSHALDKP